MTVTDTVLERLAGSDPADDTSTRARAWLETHGFPGKRDEAWRTTPVDEILAVVGEAGLPPPPPEPLDRPLIDELAGDHGGRRLVFVNGVHAPDLSDGGPLPAGFYVGALAGAPARATPPWLAVEPVDGFDALNRLAGRDAAVVAIPRGARLDGPVHIVHLAAPGSGPALCHPRTVVLAAGHSYVSVIETYTGLAGRSVTNASTSVVAGPAARVTYQRVQAEVADAIHLGRMTIGQAAGSDVRAVSVMSGAAVARFAADIILGGPEARLALDGLYLPRGRQRHDHVITVDHAASRCTSTQRFKGIVDDHGYGSFVGRVIVRPGTAASDAGQANHSLLLRPTAQADTRPWLEIFADEVRCTHGATVGRLDEEALFYLRSRGVSLPEARAMLVAAFASEVTDGLTPTTLRERVIAAARPGEACP